MINRRATLRGKGNLDVGTSEADRQENMGVPSSSSEDCAIETIQPFRFALWFHQMHREVIMSISRIYPHRHNKDGSYDSICLTCFLTISHAETEAELTQHDSAHVCNVTLLSSRAHYRQTKALPDRLLASIATALG